MSGERSRSSGQVHTFTYLAKRGGLSFALLDKQIGSHTSPRAAGMVSCVRKGDLMTELIKDACRKIESFTDETGQPLDWVRSGSLKIARRPQDADVIAADLQRIVTSEKLVALGFTSRAIVLAFGSSSDSSSNRR
jgi:hypothetical protein